MDFEKANYAISTKDNENSSVEGSEYTKAVQQQLNLDLSNYRILAYRWVVIRDSSLFEQHFAPLPRSPNSPQTKECRKKIAHYCLRVEH